MSVDVDYYYNSITKDTFLTDNLGDERITIAVLDGPVDLQHPCFLESNLRTASILDDAGEISNEIQRHGTHVASQIFASNATLLVGLAPKCTGLLIPVYRASRDGKLHPSSQVDLARAIRTAADAGAHVINISGGELSQTPEADQFLEQAISYCEKKSILVVAAAGNNGCDCLHVPASIPTVLAVGAMDRETGTPLGFSNWGTSYRQNAILAPGKNIPGAGLRGGIELESGTSFAAPIVSGIAALMLSHQLGQGMTIDPLAVRKAILEGATPCTPTSAKDCRRYLAGTLNVEAALSAMDTDKTRGTAKVLASGANGATTTSPLNTCAAAPSGVAPSPSPAHRLDGIANDASGPTNRPRRTAAPPPHSTPNQNHLFPPSSILSKSNRESTMTDLQDMAEMEDDDLAEAIQDTGSIEMLSTDPDLPEASQGVEPARASVPVERSLSDGIQPSDCDCGCGGDDTVQLVFALGRLHYDLVTEARKDSLQQAMNDNPYDWGKLLVHLKKSPWDAEDITWTLDVDATPIYAIKPVGSYAPAAYERLIDFLKGQLDKKVARISIPGVIAGTTMLSNGVQVPVVVPTLRGMYGWNTEDILKTTTNEKTRSKSENFLNRVYYELRNLGQSPEERALNYAATNAFQVDMVFKRTAEIGHELDTIDVERSPVCREDSDCWDVVLTTFDPENDRGARMRHRFTVDVSDVVPCSVGEVRSWSVR